MVGAQASGDGVADLIAAIEAVITAIRVCAIEGVIAALEAEYYYEEIEEKRWVLGSGGTAGNCEYCDGNEEMGWIGDDEVFDSYDGDIDGPPAHPNCDCELEYRTRRQRVYDD